MILPTLMVEVQQQGDTDLYGQPVLSAPTRERVSPVKLNFTTQHTTVRTDSAATHGQAYEQVADVVILALPDTKIEINSIVTVMGRKVRADSKMARHTVRGALDHYQIHCVAWV